MDDVFKYPELVQNTLELLGVLLLQFKPGNDCIHHSPHPLTLWNS